MKRSHRIRKGRDLLRCSIEEIIEDFPDTRIAFVLAQNLSIAPERSPALECAISQAEEATRARYSGQELASIPEIQDWRQAYKGFGIKRRAIALLLNG